MKENNGQRKRKKNFSFFMKKKARYFFSKEKISFFPSFPQAKLVGKFFCCFCRSRFLKGSFLKSLKLSF
jgi:hypothetical protein